MKLAHAECVLLKLKVQEACRLLVFILFQKAWKLIQKVLHVREARKVTLELILSNHDKKCLTCVRSRNCELQKLSEELNVKEIRFEGETYKHYLLITYSTFNCKRSE